jgi:hypothetical protein
MFRRVFLLLIFCLFSFFSKANFAVPIQLQDSIVVDTLQTTKDLPKRKHVRAKAIIFTVLTGPLGGHRVYLGTRPGAPIIYAVTLGGFGILPVIDLVHLIFKKDISTFEQNQKIIMWGGEDK